MFKISKLLNSSAEEIILAFDLEWTKNYRVKKGNQPFCFSFVFFAPPKDTLNIEACLNFGFYLCYCKNKKEASKLIEEANKILGNFFRSEDKTTVVGHQLSSDISIAINFLGDKNKIGNFIKLKKFWHNRKNRKRRNGIIIFDSRYDLDDLLSNKSRRLVDVCKDCCLKVEQPELEYSSMTKMQNNFYAKKDKMIMEKIAVLNIRHSLSAAILFLFFKQRKLSFKKINVNKIIAKNLFKYFSYVKSKEFKKLL